ncbi:response regulator [Paenibacillus massiliensis]|uniref:response regulator n=1 Tax=Paenibacillus massiliensis TaxID=225917 RepID=UPI00048C0B74|nr:response regulator [Paenibacillus massiliensis]
MHLNRVILVDDEVFTRKGLLKLVDWTACGFEIVEEADNGEDALEIIERLQPDVVITDIRMPVLDGLELIRRVKSQGTANPYFMIVSGYDEFNYAKQAVRFGVHDFILKPIDEAELSDALVRLSKRLAEEREARYRTNQLLSESLMESLIMGEVDSVLLREWESRLQLQSSERLYYVFVELNDHDFIRPRVEDKSDGEALKTQVELALREVIGTDHPLYLHEHRNRIGVIVPERMISSMDGHLQAFAVQVQRLLSGEQRRVLLYFSKPVQGLDEMQQAYASAKEALQYKYVYDECGIVLFEDTIKLELHYIGLEESLYTKLLEQIEELQFEELEQTIHDLFRTFQSKLYAPEAVKTAINQCVLGVVRVLNRMGGQQDHLASLEAMMIWHDHNLSLRELKRLFTTFAVESAHYIAQLRREQQKGGIGQIRAYIETHFHHNISLKSIAAKFYMNPVYLGQLFKKTYGIYFNDFLLQLRVSEAKRLLRQTDLRIYEIAGHVGFANPDYFVTQFEKMERSTPTEYRTRLLNETGLTQAGTRNNADETNEINATNETNKTNEINKTNETNESINANNVANDHQAGNANGTIDSNMAGFMWKGQHDEA